jgi:hypothetical protein
LQARIKMSTPLTTRPEAAHGPEPIYEAALITDTNIDVEAYLRSLEQRALSEPEKLQAERELPTVTIDDGRKVEREDKELITKIVYPGREKTREVTRADANGRPLEIVTTNSEGNSTRVNRDGKWFAKFQGMEMPLPGGVRFDRRSGDFLFELGTPGLWQREKVDGTASQEKANSDGSIVFLNAQGGVGTITRRDNSSISQVDANMIVETSAAGQSSEWKPANGEWVNSQNPQQKRRNMKLDVSGVVTYDTPEGDNFRIGGDGSLCQQGPGKAKFTFDNQNRIARIEWPNGNARDFAHFGDSRDLKTITAFDRQCGTTYINERADAKSSRWDVQNTQGHRVDSWHGQAMLSQNGVYSRRYTDSQGNSRDGQWSTIWQDGAETKDDIDERGNRTAYDNRGKVRFKESEDGSRSTCDEAGKLTFVRTKSGDTFEVPEFRIKMFNSHTGETVNFTNNGGKWTSDSKNYPGERLALTVTENGKLSFNTGGDKKYLQGTDGMRSPVGKIFDETCSIMGGRRQPNGGNYGGLSGCRNIMYKVTGDIVADSSHLVNRSERDSLLLNGAYITYAPGHMRCRQIKRDGDGWVIIQDGQHGERSDRVISRVRDIRQWLKENADGRMRRNTWRSNNDDPFGPNPRYPGGEDYPDGPGTGPDDDDCRPRIRIRRFPILRRLFGRFR